MPIYDADHVEYTISTGHIQIVMDDGRQYPAYWAHPRIGSKFPALALVHDWWGITDIVRRMVNLFAQTGYYVIAPDLFDGKVAANAQEAIPLVEVLGAGGYPRVDAALGVLEKHTHTNGDVAAVGIGMGGSLAYEAAIVRDDLEAAISYYGFPQRYMGRFKDAKAPILAIYGNNEPHISPEIIGQLHTELAISASKMHHKIMVIEGAGHDFFSDTADPEQRDHGRLAWHETLTFLEQHLKGRTKPPEKPVY